VLPRGCLPYPRRARARQIQRFKGRGDLGWDEYVGTCFPGQVDPMGEWRECLQSSTENGNSSVNLASQGHYTGVFIGTRVSTVLW
jgi:hypothetical protein